MKEKSPYLFGLIGSVSLLLFYFLVMTTLTGSTEAALDQFKRLWWIMLPISISFGVQVSLYHRLKRVDMEKSRKVIAGTGLTSGMGMIACCVHHLVDVLPLLGLSALSIFLSSYQIPILLTSLIINLIGIKIMLNHLRMLNYVSKS